MAQLGKAQTGLLKSTPKLTRINGDDNLKVIWRNMGNNHAYPFVWGVTATVASGLFEVVLVASGTKFHGFDLLTYANVTVTPNYDAGDFYVTKDTSDGKIKLTLVNAGANDGSSSVDVKYMLGADPDITGISCGTWSKDNIKQDLP
jgi:hypothetical protein